MPSSRAAAGGGPDLALTRELLNEKFDRLLARDRTLLESIVAFDVFVRTAARCRARTKAVRLRIQRTASAV